MGFGSSDASSAQSSLAAQQAQAVSQGAAGISKAFSGFTPSFYQGRQQAYENYALPQVGNQFRQTNQQLDESLANRGLTNSSAAQQEKAQLQTNLNQAQQQVASTGQQQAQQLQQNVQGQQNALVGELQNSVAPNTVAQQAVGTAAQFQAPSTFAPIGNLFSNFSNAYLANQYSNTLPAWYSNPLTAFGSRNAGAGSTGGNNFVTGQ